jgi:hypothetical protein
MIIRKKEVGPHGEEWVEGEYIPKPGSRSNSTSWKRIGIHDFGCAIL